MDRREVHNIKPCNVLDFELENAAERAKIGAFPTFAFPHQPREISGVRMVFDSLNDLWVMKISDNPREDELEPEVKYIANMHGDEITGREMMLRLIADLGANYGKDPEITQLVQNTEIFIFKSS